MQRVIQVQITDRCNMKCPYCYIHQKTRDMTLETFIKQFKNCYKLDEYYGTINGYNIAYFGGEPLLNLETIYEIEEYLKEIHIEHTSHIQTNSLLLTNEIVEDLKKYNIAWGFSFDGLWQNDILAYNENGILENSFNIFNRNFKKYSFLHKISKTIVSPDNIKKYSLLENYCYFLNELSIRNPDFTLVRDNIWTKDDIELYKKQLKELTDFLIEKTIDTKKMHSVGLLDLFFKDTIYGRLYGKRPFGCFAGYNGICVTPIGIIYPCARFYTNNLYPLYDTEKNILYEENIKKLYKLSPNTVHKKCHTCKLNNYCNGGCTYSQFVYNNYNSCEPIDDYCEILKFSYNMAYHYYMETKEIIDYFKIF